MSTITPEESEASPPLRSHRCGELRASDDNRSVSLCGWVQRRRDHGGLRFVDLRDGSGLVQLVSRKGSPVHAALERIAVESVVRVQGRVILRESGQVNAELPTGEVEVQLAEVEVLGPCTELPFSPIARTLPSEEIRLRHRYLDLRRRALRDNILLRTRVIASLRRRMEALGFLEIQTPILTASSPEGARDFVEKPFNDNELVDRVIEMDPKQRIVAVKNVTMNEPFFTGHFPGVPVMPGVLIVESMAQAGAVLLLHDMPDRDQRLVYFTGIDNARFRRAVTPGDQIRLSLEVVKLRSRTCKMHGRAEVDGQLVAEADIMSALVDREP